MCSKHAQNMHHIDCSKYIYIHTPSSSIIRAAFMYCFGTVCDWHIYLRRRYVHVHVCVSACVSAGKKDSLHLEDKGTYISLVIPQRWNSSLSLFWCLRFWWLLFNTIFKYFIVYLCNTGWILINNKTLCIKKHISYIYIYTRIYYVYVYTYLKMYVYTTCV